MIDSYVIEIKKSINMYLEDKIREGKNMKEDDIILVINIESYLSTTKL